MLQGEFQKTRKVKRRRCLKTIIKNEEIWSCIEQDVIEMSNLAIEASILIYYTIYSQLYSGVTNFKTIRFLDYFRQLLDESKEYYLSEQYSLMRSANGLGKYNGTKWRRNIFVHLSKCYGNIFRNNISKHAYNRVSDFLKNLNPEADQTDIYKNLSYLFDNNSKHIKTLNFNFEWNKGHFYNIKNSQMEFVYDFFRIQQINESNEWENFTLVPIFNAGRNYIKYDVKSFYRMLFELGLVKTKSEFEWSNFLNVDNNFSGSFKTDGVAILLDYDEPISKPDCNYCEYDLEVGIDPGKKIVIAAVKEARDGYREYIKVSNDRFRYDNGSFIRENKFLKWTEGLESAIKFDRGTLSSTHASTFEEFVKFNLKWFKLKQLLYSQKKFARLKQDRSIRRDATIHRYIKDYIVGDFQNVVVYFGDASVASNHPMNGFIHVPGKRLKYLLQNHQRITVISVDEFKTTKLCSICHNELNFYTNKQYRECHSNRFTSCQTCGNVCHRDINAANNILKLGRSMPIRPSAFSRNKCSFL